MFEPICRKLIRGSAQVKLRGLLISSYRDGRLSQRGPKGDKTHGASAVAQHALGKQSGRRGDLSLSELERPFAVVQRTVAVPGERDFVGIRLYLRAADDVESHDSGAAFDVIGSRS